MDTSKLRGDCGSVLLIKKASIGRSVACPRCGQTWGVTAADFPDTAGSRRSRRDLVLVVAVAAMVTMLTVAWGMTRRHQSWQPDLSARSSAYAGSAPEPMPVDDLADADPVPSDSSPAARPAPAARNNDVGFFDGVGSASAPKKIEKPSAPTPPPADAKKEPPVVADAGKAAPAESPRIPDIKPDGFDAGFVPPPPPETKTASTNPASQGMNERFKQWDKNGDGKLTKDEVPSERFFRMLDKDGDGTVTPQEIEAFASQARQFGDRRGGGDGQGRPGRGGRGGDGGGRDDR